MHTHPPHPAVQLPQLAIRLLHLAAMLLQGNLMLPRHEVPLPQPVVLPRQTDMITNTPQPSRLFGLDGWMAIYSFPFLHPIGLFSMIILLLLHITRTANMSRRKCVVKQIQNSIQTSLYCVDSSVESGLASTKLICDPIISCRNPVSGVCTNRIATLFL